MTWRDLGLIFPVCDLAAWAASHAYVPTLLALDDRIRVFAAFWDVNRVGRLGFVDLDRADPERILGHSREPILSLGPEGSFDARGQTPLSVLWDGSELRLYYAGWQADPVYRYRLFTGLATSRNGGDSFIRYSDDPVIGPTAEHPQVRTGGMVMKEDGRYRTWFAESIGSIEHGGKAVPAYTLSHMTSEDGIAWPDRAQVCFPVVPGVIFGYGRSAIWRQPDGSYHGLFSVRREIEGYTIGHATSPDGLSWNPLDLEGGMAFTPAHCIDGPQEVMFPSLHFQADGTVLMVYNGRDFGREGVRAAVWTPTS